MDRANDRVITIPRVPFDRMLLFTEKNQAIIHESLSFDALVKIVPIGLATKSQHSKLVILEE